MGGPNVALAYTAEGHGPIFDGSINSVLRKAQREIEDEVGELAVTEVRARFSVVLRHPTGYLSSRVTATREGEVVNVGDNGVPYGPWIEGVGSRNATSSFKGYQTFAKVAIIVDRQVPDIAERVLNRFLM